MDPRSKNPFFGAPSLRLNCYLDETGQTGLNHFDENQQHFMLGCAISNSDLDLKAKLEFDQIHQEIKSSELHANKLGPNKLAEIQHHVIKIIDSYDVKFVFVDIEKQHNLNMMMFHHFYDPGLNPAATNSALVFRIQRLSLAYNFSSVVSVENRRDFWNSTQKGDINLYVETLKNIKEKVRNSDLDHRSQELIGDALAYTIKNPEKIFGSMTFNEIVSPNTTSLGLLLNTLQSIYFNKNVVIDRFIHDEQKQFGKFLKQSYDVLSKFYNPASQPLDSMIDLRSKKLLAKTDIQFLDSSKSIGLQLIDTALWVFKRHHYGKYDSAIQSLRDFIVSRTTITGVTQKMHTTELMDLQKKLYSKDVDLSPENIERAKKLIESVESKRWKE